MLFLGRDRELALLDRALAAVRRHGQLVVLSGRRGSGKTALVQHWLTSRRRRAFVWTAQPDTGELDQATSFAQGLRRHWGLAGDAVRPFALETWRKAFFQVAAAAETGRRIVVIDSDGFAKPPCPQAGVQSNLTTWRYTSHLRLADSRSSQA